MSRKLIIVTGGAGFIGINFLNFILDKEDCEIWVVDNLTYASHKELIPDSQKIKLIEKSISNSKEVGEVFSNAQKEFSDIYIFHLAAESHVDRSIKSGSLFIETNVLGTQNLLEWSSKIGVNKFVHVSTDEVYGDIPEGESLETDLLKPSSAYAASKAASDLLVIAHERTHGLCSVITRCTNNFGSNQSPEKFIPRVINRMVSGQSVPVYGKGDQVREWIPVMDHARGIWAASCFGESGEIYNLGSGWRQTNLQIISRISDILQIEPKIDFIEDRLGHDKRYALDSSKSNTRLNWQISKSTEKLFEETVLKIASDSLTVAGKKRFQEMEKFYAN